MRIISTKKDYYDCVQRHDQDRSLIFHRTHIPEIILDRKNRRKFYFGEIKEDISEYYIGFCGKTYPLLGIQKRIDLYWTAVEYKTVYCYSLEDIRKNFEIDKKFDKDFQVFFESKPKEDYFQRYNTPCYILKIQWETSIEINPLLKDYEFFRIFDTNSAYQELCMYLGNQAYPNKKIPVVSDEDLIIAKGFDKFSFRKDKRKNK